MIMKNNSLFVIFSLKPGGTQRMMVNVLNEIATPEQTKILYLYNYTSENTLENQLESEIKVYKCINKGPFKHMFRLFLLIRIIQQEKINRIISFSTNGTYMSIFSKLFLFRNISLVYRLVSIDSALTQSKSSIIHFINKLFFIHVLCRKSDTIISQSNFMSSSLISKNQKLLKNKITTISNILPIHQIEKKANEPIDFKEPYLLFVGRLSKEKNILGIIKAYQLIKSRIKEKLLIIGSGYEQGVLNQYVQDNNLDNSVLFLGNQSNPYKYISKANSLILFSNYEGMPNVVLEAMICKTAAIVSDFDGYKDIITDGKTGLVVERNNIEHLSKAIVKLALDERYRNDCGENAYRFIQQNNKNAKQQYYSVFNDVSNN
jgi:N-acetylgalactosamine-N,N'-diacetylbacillosaminyl-diphospho-undecaprenol 4-alpha-N-acetylgalactosaminyltransferase